jgi:hypothetical protein
LSDSFELPSLEEIEEMAALIWGTKMGLIPELALDFTLLFP